MTSIVLEGPIAELREREIRWLHAISENAGKFGEDGLKDRDRIQKNADDLRDMFFMVVIIGEFNAGKSTFVNALLGDEMLPMGITPTTDAIELVRYSRDRSKNAVMREDGTIREWMHPNTGAPGVVIVDTPGTGSVFAKHERIAKEFLSRSDLVIFLISAKRAFAQTEKIYLELARDYGKKIILVINQVDLLEKKEQKDVRAFVKQQVSELLNIEPPIFMISAKKALKGGRTGGLFSGASSADDSGIDEVKTYLRGVFEKVPPAKQKLYAQLDFGDSMIKKYTGIVNQRLDLVSDDERQAKQLREELEKQAGTLNNQLDTSMRELDRVFDQIRERGRKFITDNLSFNWSVRVMDRDEARKKFESDVVGSALEQINTISEDYVNAVVDSSRRYWRSIIERLNRLEALLKEHIASPDAGSYADQRVALQEAIAIADAQLKTYTEDNLAENLHEIFSTNMVGFSASIVGVIGGLLAFAVGAAAPGALTATAVGVVLGIVAAPVMLVGGGAAAYSYWRKLRNDAYKELDDRLGVLKKSYHQALNDLTERERARLLQYGQQILSPVFSHLDVLAENFRTQKNDLEKLTQDSKTLRQDIDSIKIVTE